jgi:hypothetical protein
MKAVRIFLFILIIIGISLLLTQKFWVPKLIDRILLSENTSQSLYINELQKTDLIRVDSPQPNQTIQSPLTITGVARGSWFFEASFPVVLTNWDGLIIGKGIANAKGNWMTTDFVPFEARLTFTVDKKSYSNKGTLILRKDNSSGLSKNDDAIEIPVILEIKSSSLVVPSY